MALSRAVARDGTRPLWLRSLGYWAFQYKRTWRSSVTTSFLEPLLYLAAMGIGLGTLVDHHVHHVQGVSYLTFVGPGLLASAAMQVGVSESTYPVMGAIKWIKTYHAMLATPLRVIDVLAGHFAWIALRLTMVSAIFLGILAAFGLTRSAEALLTIPAAVLTGLAFAAPIMAFAATQEKDAAFSVIYRFGVVPLFLFSGIFFPITRLPGWLQPVAWATPLYHGVALCRALVLGQAAAGSSIEHTAYLVALIVAGYGAATLTYRRRLVV
ncbi:MAG: ABC transporter permease [Actinomycetota bacterium]|jgi:lipooligosaccharide transport system permease protein|nr:ABC transporter permease [Actinomycetota bacterium]